MAQSIAVGMFVSCCLGVLLLVVAAGPAHADELPAPVDRFRAFAGPFWSDNSLRVRWDASASVLGTQVDFQRDLGFGDSRDLPYWDLSFAMGEERQHKIGVHGQQYDDSGHLAIHRELAIGENVYPASAELATSFDMQVTGLSYTWFFQRNARQASGVGMGLMRHHFELGIDSFAELGNGSVHLANHYDQTVWLPMLRGEYTRTLSATWRWNMMASWITKPSGSLTGDAFNAYVELEWLPWRNVGLAARYAYSNIHFELEQQSFLGEVKFRQHGPQVVAVVRF